MVYFFLYGRVGWRPLFFIGSLPGNPSFALSPVPREGIGSLAKSEKQILGGAIPRRSISLEIVSLLPRLHDDDALCLPRHAGHVSDVPFSANGNFSP